MSPYSKGVTTALPWGSEPAPLVAHVQTDSWLIIAEPGVCTFSYGARPPTRGSWMNWGQLDQSKLKPVRQAVSHILHSGVLKDSD